MFTVTDTTDTLDKIDDSLFAMLNLPYSATGLHVLDDRQLVVSISQYALDLQTERQRLGDELDRHHATLWVQERALVAELYRTGSEESRSVIGATLDLVRYKMTVISDQLDHGSDCDCDDGIE